MTTPKRIWQPPERVWVEARGYAWIASDIGEHVDAKDVVEYIRADRASSSAGEGSATFKLGDAPLYTQADLDQRIANFLASTYGEQYQKFLATHDECDECGNAACRGTELFPMLIDNKVEARCWTCLQLTERTGSAGEDAQVDEVSAALAELREMFPGCSFELVSRYNAGFYKTPERYFDIGVISPDYHFNERIDSAGSLADAMQKVRERKEQQ